MEPIEISDGVYAVGVTDWNIRDFHGYSTDIGTTYNAFLIVDEKIALIDTVREGFADQLLENISRIVDLKKIDYVISNHTEMDHSGGLARVMHRIGEDKPIYCSKMGSKNLPKHFSQKWNYQPVATGDELSLGKRTLTFLETRMIHWPDSMFTYLNENQILFSSDGFGQHYAGPEKFDDQIDEPTIMHPPKEFFEKAVSFFRNYADKYHHYKEEFLMFGFLAQKKEGQLDLEIGSLRHQHETGRRFLTRLEKSIKGYAKKNEIAITSLLENMASFISILSRHIYREDNLFFPMVEKELSTDQKATLLEQFKLEEEALKKRNSPANNFRLLEDMEKLITMEFE